MSIRQMSEVWDLDLAPNKRLILLAYADHADDDGEHVYPSLARVAHKTGYGRDQVRRISRQLVEDGLMELVEKGDHSHPHRYRMTLDRGSKLQPLKPRRKRQDATPGVANDPSMVGAPMQPEPPQRTAIEPSDTSLTNVREVAESPKVDPPRKDGKPPEKPKNWMTFFADRAEEFSYGVTPEDRRELPKNFNLVASEVNEKTMRRVVLKCLESRTRGYPISPQRALADLTGKPQGRATAKEAATPATPEPALAAVRSHDVLSRYASVAERWDFTRSDEPPKSVEMAMGGDDGERWANLKRMQSVCRRAVRENETEVA